MVSRFFPKTSAIVLLPCHVEVLNELSDSKESIWEDIMNERHQEAYLESTQYWKDEVDPEGCEDGK